MAFSKGLPKPATADHFKAFFNITTKVPRIETIPINTQEEKQSKSFKKEDPSYLSRFSRIGRTPMTIDDIESSDEDDGQTDASCQATKSHWDNSLISGDMKQLEVDTIYTGMQELNVASVEHPTLSDAYLYENYDFGYKFDSNLPIFQHKEEILETIKRQSVTVIEGMTGSGKTTQVPQYILDDCYRNKQYCNIVVTQPRKIAACSITRRVCDERKWTIGRLVGYQVGLDKVTSEDTRITYMTVGVLLRKLVNAKNLNEYTHIILDEVHERDQDTDFAMLIVRKFLRSNSQSVKVILMSATFNIKDFCDYFAGLVDGTLKPADSITVKGQSHDVYEHYLNDIMILGPISSLDPVCPDISEQVFDIAVKLIRHFDDLEKEMDSLSTSSFPFFDDNDGKSMSSFTSSKRGSVLVFLPGLFYIREMEQILQSSTNIQNLQIVPLHSSITMEEQSEVFSKPKVGIRKVILATNIAESSITVPDVKYVIDFCLTKALVCDLGTNYQSLRLQWASKANCNQRKGRAGRVSNGRVYRLVTKDFWNNSIPDEGIPEMQRCPLEHLVLQVKLLNLGNPKAILYLAMSPPCLEDIERTILLLKEIGAISTVGPTCNQRHDGELTFVGRVLANIPLDMRLSKLLLLGYVFGCLSDCIIIAASLTRGGFFSTPYKKWLDSYKQKLKWADGSFSDCIALLNAYRKWEDCVRLQKFRRRRDEYDWCKRHYIQPRRLHEVHLQVNELFDRLEQFNIRSRDQDFWKDTTLDTDRELILKVVMAGAFYPNYFRSTYPDDDKDIMRTMCELDSRRAVRINGFPAHQGALYAESIVETFKECGRVESLHYDGSKAYVNFAKEDDCEYNTGSVLSSVYVALRMREPRRRIIVQQSRNSTPFTDRLLNKLFLYEPVSSYAHNKVVLRPGSESEFKVRVTHIETADRFFGFKLNKGSMQTQRDLYKDVQKEAETGRRYKVLVAPGDLVLAPFYDGQDTAYYRAIVIKLTGMRVNVTFVDYGNKDADIPLQKLVHMSESMKRIPFQAIEFELAELCVLPNIQQEKTRELISKIVQKSNYTVDVQIYSVVSERVRAIVSAGDININNFLIDQGIAEKVEENKLSEKNHWQWEMANRDKITDEDDKRFRRDWKLVPENSRGSVIPPAQRKKAVQIYGPDNALQMNFTSCINIGRMRNVCVVRDSVNTVAINDNPQNPYMQMMVAASVGVNESGSTMLVSDTTLMPRIQGLRQIITMLFTPVMELRVDKHYQEHIGALCGLGAWVSKNGRTYAILPEHDVELFFNTKISPRDISDINGLRMMINMSIGTNELIATWSQSAIHKMQRKARSSLVELIRRKREPKKPTGFYRPYKWNQIDKAYLLPHNINEKDADNKSFYRLHDSVMLATDDFD